MSTHLRMPLQEAALICVAAALLGFAYSAVTGRGILGGEPLLQRGLPPGDGSGPSMISAEEAYDLFRSDEAVFVDTRHAFDFRLGHIKGALNIPLNEYTGSPGAFSGIPPEKIVITYCDGEDCNSSIELAGRMYEQGLSRVRIFFGGWEEWVARGLPVEVSP